MNLNIFQFIVLQAVVLWYRQKKFYVGVVVDLKLQQQLFGVRKNPIKITLNQLYLWL